MRKLLTENPVEVLKIFLKRLGIKFTQETIHSLTMHPDFPALISFSHVLTKLGIDNVSVRASYNELLTELPKPMLVHLFSNGGMYLVIESISDSEVQFINKKNELESHPKDDFIKTWSGVALIAGNNIPKAEPNYRTNLMRELISRAKIPFVVATLILMLSTFIMASEIDPEITYLLFFITKVSGLLVSILLIIQMVDKNNPFVKKLCSPKKSGHKVNCASVLNAPGAYIFGLISWSEIGLIYFSSQFLFLLFENESLDILSAIAVIAASYIFYSIYYQWKVARSWCRLCLFVQCILFSELLIGIGYIVHRDSLILPSFLTLFVFLSLIFFIIATYSLLKPVLIEWHAFKKQFPKLNKIKLNQEVFNQLLLKSRGIDTSLIKPIQIGNSDTKNKITIITNPTCAPCIDMHKKIFRILHNKSNCLINEIFLTESDKTDLSYKVAETMLGMFEAMDVADFKTAIVDYYSNHSTVPDRWLSKYNREKKELVGEKSIDAHLKWCREKGFYSTPVIFYNNRLLPAGYTVDDLEYLID